MTIKPRLFMESNSNAVMDMISGISGIMEAQPGGAEAAPIVSNQVKVRFERAFKALGEAWAEDLTDSVNTLAAANNTSNDDSYGPAGHWTRHLYRGGNPANMGDPSQALFDFMEVPSSDGVGIRLDTGPDSTPSWSPITKSTTSEGKDSRPYPEWKGRASFMLGRHAGGYDSMYTSGTRTEGQPLYIIGKKSRTKVGSNKYILAKSFKRPYNVEKSERDRNFSAMRQTTTNGVMEVLDRGENVAMNKAMKILQAKVGAKSVASLGNLQKGVIKPSYNNKRFGHDPKVASRYAVIFADEFLSQMKIKGRLT